MQTFAAVLLLVAGCQAATPVDKVISLLTKLTAQVQEEGAHEAASYDKYACFCKDQADSKTYVIAASDKKIEYLDAEITELTGEISSLDSDVSTAKESVTTEEGTQKDNLEAREKDEGVYSTKRKSLVEAVDAVERALSTMRNSRDDVDKAMASLLQTLPSQSPALALIAGATAGKRYQKPGEAKSYQYASKEVIATLTSLTTTFKKELQELDTTEMNDVSTFEMTRGARINTIKSLNKEITEKETLSASKSETKADKEGLKTEETTARNADQGFLDDLTLKCEEKAKAWDERSTTRAGELTALTQAVELLKGMGNLYGTNSKLVGLVSKSSQVNKPASFLQLRSIKSTNADKLEQVTMLLNKEAHSLKSAPLGMLALKLQAAGPDHFVKVRGIINDLIAKLEADAASEATAKGICDESMKTAIEKRDKNAGNYETAGANIDSTTSDIAALKKEISEISEEVATMNKDLLQMEELRAEQKAQNEKAIKDANEGKTTVDAAITLLNDFYGTTLLQAKQTPTSRDGKSVGDMAPETFSSDEKYKGKADSSKGIIGILEVISADFERTSTTVTTAETEGEADYNTLKDMQDKSIKDKNELKGTKETDVETKESDLTGYKDELKDAKTMNEQALEELEKLTASCVSTGESFEERAKHRKEEIEALKSAMEILENWKD